MDEPARKRRKTASPEGDRLFSPLKQPPRRPSISSRSYHAAEDRPQSPLKAPPRRFSMSPTKGVPGRSSSPLKEPPRRPPRRPSFASPTKASLARGYPDLLQRPSHAPAQNGRADMLARGKQARAFVMGEQDNGVETESEAALEERDGTVAGAQSPLVPKIRPETTPRAHRSQPRTKERITNTVMEEEVDLPATPSQRSGKEQFLPRPGLFSSPSKRPPRLDDPTKKTRSPKKPIATPQDIVGTINGYMQSTSDDGVAAQQDKGRPPDPEIEEKKREKARLEKELRLLERQVSKGAEEIAKMKSQYATHIGSPEEREALVTLINELGKTGEDHEEKRAPTLSSMLCSFLPFAAQGHAPPKPQSDHVIASHRPLELDNPLPYLQMFTSFDIRTKLDLARAQNPASSNRVYQKHVVDITGPQSLLTASIAMTIDVLSNKIIVLKLLHLPHWADRELGSFMRARAKENDLGNACWAIESYWNIIKKRAEFWHQCEMAFGYLIPGRTREDTENHNAPGQEKPGEHLSRKDLHRHLGRDALVLEDAHVLLKISWKIGFDWTGEAESEVGVEPAVPRVWREADSNDSFKKIPETFTSLLQSRGVFAATKTMVALLFTK